MSIDDRSSPAPNPAARIARRALVILGLSAIGYQIQPSGLLAGMSRRVTAVNRSTLLLPRGTPSNFNPFHAESIVSESYANLSLCLAAAAIGLTTGFGPRRPNAARALCEESDFD